MNDLNNAKLLSVRAYHRWVDAFRQLLREHTGDWPALYQVVGRLAALPAGVRRQRLEALVRQWHIGVRAGGCIMVEVRAHAAAP